MCIYVLFSCHIQLRIAFTNFVRSDHEGIDMSVIGLFLFELNTRWPWRVMVHPHSRTSASSERREQVVVGTAADASHPSPPDPDPVTGPDETSRCSKLSRHKDEWGEWGR